jgi:hypothetical protein
VTRRYKIKPRETKPTKRFSIDKVLVRFCCKTR